MSRRIQPLSALIASILLTAPATMSQAAPHPETPLSYEVLFGSEGRGKAPSRLTWRGETLTFLYQDDLWVWPGQGEAEVLLTAGELAEGPDEPTLAQHHWSADGSTLLIESDGDLFLWERSDRRLRRLTDTSSTDEDPKFSPDGRTVSFVRDANLWSLDLDSGVARQLTSEGRPDILLFGKTDWVYWEELWGRNSTGHWWSPDGSKLALYRFDDSHVARYPLLDMTGGLDPTVTHQPYPRAGTRNPSVRVGVMDPNTRQIVWMKTLSDADPYLPRVTWLPDGSRLAVHRLDRAQAKLEILLCDPTSGDCEVFLEESSNSWIDIEDDFRFLADGRFIHGSDRDGWRGLYLYSDQGEVIRKLTPDGLAVTSLDAIVDDSVIFTGYRGGDLQAKDRHVYRAPLTGANPERLTAGEGTHSARVSERGKWVLTASEANVGTWMGIYDLDTGQIGELPQEAPGIDRATLPEWQFLMIPGPDGSTLPARFLEPAGKRRKSGHPVIMYHYGGPASQQVVDAWSSNPVRDLWHLRQAQRGYGVLIVDNEASLFFGKAGAARVHRRFGDTELAAQKAGVDYLKTLSWVDADRIGLWGWSGGGANTLYSLFRSPGTWAAGVAGAPVTDWRLYDTIWTERYMGHPDDNPDGYTNSSPITWAENLADPLLLVHGTGDDNVHPNNTFVLSKKLIDAGLPFEQAIYPRQKHGFNPKESRHFYEKMEAFFDRWLEFED